MENWKSSRNYLTYGEALISLLEEVIKEEAKLQSPQPSNYSLEEKRERTKLLEEVVQYTLFKKDFK